MNHFVPLLKKMYIKACVFDLNEDITISDEQFIETSKTFFEKLDPNNHNCTTYVQGCVHCEFNKVMKAKAEFDEEYKDDDPNIVCEHFIHNNIDDEIRDFRESVLDLLLDLPIFSKKRFTKRYCVVLDSIQISLFNYLQNNVPSEFNKFLYVKDYY
jgi:hypothetical protein